MKYLVIVSILMFAFNLFGQNSLKQVKLKDDYNSQKHSQDESDRFYFNLSTIQNSNYKYYFRYRKNSQIIDLFSNNGINFNGRLINEIKQLRTIKTDQGKSTMPDNYIFEIVNLNSLSSTKIGKLILEEKFNEVPTDSLIKNWNFNWMDCDGISFQFKVQNRITDSNYSCPMYQKDSVQYVSNIKRMYDIISNTLNLIGNYNNFKVKLEKGKQYSNGFISMYIMTNKQSKVWNKAKPKRDYLKSIRDTIDNYLNIKINELIVKPKKLNCFDEYYLTFSKNGSLRKIDIKESFFKKIKDREYYNCKKIISNAFRKIKIDFVDPKYSFNRRMSFYDNKVTIYDSTVY